MEAVVKALYRLNPLSGEEINNDARRFFDR